MVCFCLPFEWGPLPCVPALVPFHIANKHTSVEPSSKNVLYIRFEAKEREGRTLWESRSPQHVQHLPIRTAVRHLLQVQAEIHSIDHALLV